MTRPDVCVCVCIGMCSVKFWFWMENGGLEDLVGIDWLWGEVSFDWGNDSAFSKFFICVFVLECVLGSFGFGWKMVAWKIGCGLIVMSRSEILLRKWWCVFRSVFYVYACSKICSVKFWFWMENWLSTLWINRDEKKWVFDKENGDVFMEKF